MGHLPQHGLRQSIDMIDFSNITFSTIERNVIHRSQIPGSFSSVYFPFYFSSLEHLGLWLNCICSALGLALVGIPHYTAALFMRSVCVLCVVRSIGSSFSPTQSKARFIPLPLYPPLSPPQQKKAHGFGASIYPAFIHFVSLWGGVFYFLGMALSVH